MPQPTPPAWLPVFLQAITTADTARALAVLNGFATSHAGTAPARIKAQAVQAVVKR